jgi:antitoxin ParD1/3/4
MHDVGDVSIALPRESVDLLEASVSSGEYASAREAILDALRVWHREREEHGHRLEVIRERVRASALDTRPPLRVDEVRARLSGYVADVRKVPGIEAP